MKILFFMRSTVYVRNFESTLRLLAERGHDVHVVADPHLPESDELIERLCTEREQITHSDAPPVGFNAWSFLGLELRRAIDYLRYLRPEFRDAPKLRVRAERRAPPFVLAALRKPALASSPGRAALSRVLRWLDRAIPHDGAVEAFIREQKPDLVLVTPLVEPGSPQSEYLRGARALGIRTGLCVYSWDNLTNKGLIHDPLDVVTVWNEPMRREAVTLHGVRADRVVVTGAAAYDHWFKWGPQRSRESFCARVGLLADRPYLLYLCSSRFIAPHEIEFVRRWVSDLRASSAVLREASVLVRPHPQNADQWATADLSGLDRVVVWPPAGANPVDEESRGEYFDSIHHSAAVVGVNTSALIESAIVGRGVYTLLTPEFRDTQEGTLHFRHLREVNGGVLHVAATLGEHAAQLEAAIRQPNADDRRQFVEAFVRPYGLDDAATPRLVAALEQTAAPGKRQPDLGPWYSPLIRPALRHAAAKLARTDRGRQEKAARQDRIKQHRDAEQADRRDRLAAAKQHRSVRRASREREIAARLEAERQAHETSVATVYQNYLHVRQWARAVADSNGGAPVLSAVEQRILSGIAHIRDASPGTIATLRQWCEPISGVRAADYDAPADDLAARLKREIGYLRRMVGGELFVAEPLMLGAFGLSRRREKTRRYNEETLRFFKAVIGLHDGGVLGEYRPAPRRRLVWEIGGGWGGFAFHFKTVCPDVTYLITGAPDLFMLSAVYLMAAFPGARCRFWDPSCPDAFWRDWERVDFMFAPECAVPALRPPLLDLTVDIMAMQQMTDSRVGLHVQRAFDLGSRYFFSMLPAAAAAGEVPAAWKAIERLYWAHPIPPRIDPSTYIGDDPPPLAETDYAQLVGWRRIRV
jgi:hypothetical protein